MLALGDRRLDRTLVADLHRADLGQYARRNGDAEVARGYQGNFTRSAQLHLGGPNHRIFLEQRLSLPGVEAPLHQLDGFLDALVEAVEAGDDHDQPSAILLGGSRETVAGLVSMAGLEPVGAGHAPEKRVAVGLRNV